MADIITKPDNEVAHESLPKKPRNQDILLEVCGCVEPNSLILLPQSSKAIADTLRISIESLRGHVESAVVTGKPQVVGRYTPEVAETILIRLDKETPFILRACHKFFLKEA